MYLDIAKHNIKQALDSEKMSLAAEWCQIATNLILRSEWDGYLVDEEIETLLSLIGNKIEDCNSLESRGQYNIHVITNPWHWGGAIEYLIRWIKNASENERSILYITNPENIAGEMRIKKEISDKIKIIESPACNIYEKAKMLRAYCNKHAKHVFVHSSAFDIIPAIAFAKPGGPPVVRNNIDDHMYWPGPGNYDLVLNFRKLGVIYSEKYRGVKHNVELPILLDLNTIEDNIENNKKYIKEFIGICKNDVVIICSGSPYKYTPFRNYNIDNISNEIVKNNRNTTIVIIGYYDKEEKTIGYYNKQKIIKLGIIPCRPEYNLLLSIADIGLSSLPFGSQTAILEMGAHGLPCILPPKDIPIGICDPSFDEDLIARDYNEMIQNISNLINNSHYRKELGCRQKKQIMKHHAKDVWNNKLQEIIISLPKEHNINKIGRYEKMANDEALFWRCLGCINKSNSESEYHYNIICNKNKQKMRPYKLQDIRKYGLFKIIKLQIKYMLQKYRYKYGEKKKYIKKIIV